LFEVDSDFTGGGRGMGRAKVFNTEGQLVASAVQEGLVRQR
jgi:acyl-CoA thioesterase-2